MYRLLKKNLKPALSMLIMVCMLCTGIVAVSAVPADAGPALKSISLGKTWTRIKPGDKITLKLRFNPSGASVSSKRIKWSSSNSKVLTVKAGKVTAKKAGKATVTAKVGKRTAKCVITVKKRTKYHSNPDQAYKYFNKFRTDKKNWWYWNKKNTAKIRVKGLKKLKRDPELEAVAELRAKEAWETYEHTRPNGKSCFTAYPDDLRTAGENLAWSEFYVMSGKEVITGDDEGWNDGWAETSEKYARQDHRRNMLSDDFTLVGIACYTKNDVTCWAMCLGKR